jgi:hypothetical protein
MQFQNRPCSGIFVLFLAVPFIQATVMSEEPTAPGGTNTWTAADSRFGLLNGLDHRSAYNREFFLPPLLVPETGLETDGELQLNSLHTQAGPQRSDNVTAEIQESLGMAVFELDVPYERISDSDDTARGIGNIELGARYPLYQFVSAEGFLDTTLGVAVEAGIPVNTAVSRHAELEPELFNDLKLGEHFSLQTVLGQDTLFGGGPGGGLQTLDYGLAFGWTFPHEELPLPGVQQFTPLFELAGETTLNQKDAGENSLLGSLGFRLAFKPLGEVQPGLGLGFVFPLNSAARDEVHWGIATSLTFEF